MGSAEGSNSKKEFSEPTMNSSLSSSSLLKITILVVDDDSTSLAIISAMLKECRYEVASVTTPVDALSTLRAHPGIDLVVTDLHMPQMNGIELQRQINREFKVPVIVMSSDDKESVMLKSLAGGAVYFIVKPVNPEDLKNVWQYAVAAKKGKSVVIEEIGSVEGESSSSAGKISNGKISSVSSVNDEKNNVNRGSKRKASKKGKDDQEEDSTASARKKAKVVWTNSLHNQFLEALRHIGMEKAVPKKILEHMNVQGLTRENVASHLQKYRIFLKRVAERSCFSSNAVDERVLKSNFASGHPLLLKTAQEYSRSAGLQNIRGIQFKPGYGGSTSGHNAASLGSRYFPSHNASSSNSAQGQYGYGYGQSRLQSRLLGNPANKRLLSGNTNLLYQGTSLGVANESNLSLNYGLSGGLYNASNGLMNGANSTYTYQQQIHARPDFYNAGSSSQFRFGSPGLHCSNSTLATGNIGTISTYPSLNSSCSNNNSYAGIGLTTDKQLIGMSQTRLNVGYASANGTCNDNMNIAGMGNQTFRYMAQGGSPYPGLVGINQVSPAYSTAANQQPNTWRLPALGNGGARSDYSYDHLMKDASFDNITLSQQFSDQDYLSDLLDESNNDEFPNQPQGDGEDVQNSELSSCSIFPEIFPSLDELLNSEFSESLSLEETAPRRKQAPGQASPLYSRFPYKGSPSSYSPILLPLLFLTFVGLPSFKVKQSGEEQLTDSKLGSVFPVKNIAPASGDDSSDNQA
ncbi:hypothetical protein DITRI_Ditri07aG0079700 [Diplodiscus trichospermus]